MSDKVKVAVGLILFSFVFTLKFLNGNCQVVTALHSDIVADSSRLQSQVWGAGASLMVEDPNKTHGSNNQEHQTWINDDGQSHQRRQKKRKRRPQKGYSTEANEIRSTTQTPSWRNQGRNDYHIKDENSLPITQRRRNNFRNKHVQTEITERVREPLAALEKEQTLSQLREKQRIELAAKATSSYRDKSYRRPYSQGKKESEEFIPASEPSKSSTIDLKHILKNSGGVSLSEILQQKNLSLDDLLKGKKIALLALQHSTTTLKPEIENTSLTTSKYVQPTRHIPTSILLSTISQTPISQESFQTMDLSGTLQTLVEEKQQTQYTTAEDGNDDDGDASISTALPRKNIFFPIHSKLRPGISSTTEKVSTHPPESTHRPMITMYKTRPQYRPKVRNPIMQSVDAFSSSDSSYLSTEEHQRNSDDAITLDTLQAYRTRKPQRLNTKSTTTSTTKILTSTLTTTTIPTTTAAFYQLISTTYLPESVEDKLNKTNPEDNFVDNIKNESLDNVETFDEFFDDSYLLHSETDSEEATPSITSRIDSFAKKTYGSPTQSELIADDKSSLNDRYELLELMEDRRSGNRLFKVLAQRNMTLDELIDHRRRGSSELHLAQIAENRTKLINDAQRRIFHSKLDIVTAFENFPHFNLANLQSIKPDEIKIDSQGSSYFTSIIDIEPTNDRIKETVSSGPTMQAQQQNRHEKSLNFFPSWKTLALASLTSQETSSLSNIEQQSLSQPVSSLKIKNPISHIENENIRAHDLVDLELSGHGFKRSAVDHVKNVPSGIRSAIIASSVIVGIALATFLVIFTICRWQQRQRMRRNYSESFNSIPSKLPAIISRQSTQGRMEELEVSSPIIFPSTQHSGNVNNSRSHLSTTDQNSDIVKDYFFGALRKPF